jgi:molybdopterin synthase catalytic subunit
VIDVRVQAGDFDPGRQISRLGELGQAAVASFVGLAIAGDEVEAIHVDHYPALARAALAGIAAEAELRWTLGGVILIHRHGRLAPGDRLAFAGVAAAAPDDALAAIAFLAEALRREVPFWRKELLAGGGSRWFRGDE